MAMKSLSGLRSFPKVISSSRKGALYPALHKLEADGLLKTEVVNIGRRIRKYFALTSPGKVQSKERAAEFVNFIQTMGGVLQVKWS